MSSLEKIIKRLNAIADGGLTYAASEFDRERYQEMKVLLIKLMEQSSDLNKAELSEAFRPTYYYPTPMVDVRAFVKNEQDEILFVRDKKRNDWALPGGYGEIGLTAKEDVLKELLEEAGLVGSVNRLLAVFDTEKWQPQAHHYYKFVFECSVLSGHFMENSETAEARFFPSNALPQPLSEHRITKAQLELLDQLFKEKTQYID